MTSHASSSSRTAVPFSKLPWLTGGIFLVLYLATLSRGAGAGGLAIISNVTGWDWQPMLQFPVYYVVSLPFRLLPVALQPVALNVLSAVLAAGTLALVTRSVQLLPQNRTREQRERERSEHGLLTGSSAWMPATAAAVVCGLQVMFWQGATNASVDILNLFLLAWVIREFLEYRIDRRERRLVVLAFVYGLGVTSDAAFITLFPFMLGGIIWAMGRSFFHSPLILKLLVAGVAGLLLYLLLPAVAVASGKVNMSFGDALLNNLRGQKAVLQTGFNNRLFPMVMCLGSLFPLILIGVRWPGSFGDISAAGSFATRMMFHVLALLFIAGSLAMNFHLQHVVKAQAETGIAFHSLFLISAIVLGYSVGYLLVVFGKQPGKAWKKPGPIGAALNKVMVAIAWLILPLVLVGLADQNYAQVHDLNVSPLYAYAAQVAQQLPREPALILSDDNTLLSLVADQLAHSGKTEHWLLHTRSLSEPGYHKVLHEITGGEWPTLPTNEVFEQKVADTYILKTVFSIATNRPVVYLHPSFGYYFEFFHPVEDRLVYDLKRYTNSTVQVPVPTEAEIQTHGKFLENWWKDTLAPLSDKIDSGRASIADNYLGQIESRALNAWGSRLQQADQMTNATPWFERAVRLFTNNVCARINLEYNRHRLSGGTNQFKLSDATLEVWKNYRDNIQLALSLGGPIDEPSFCIGLGNVFAAGHLARQAAQEFLRAVALTPNNPYPRVQLARTFLQGGAPDRALEVLKEIREKDSEALNQYARIDLASIEATALFSKGEKEKATGILDELAKRYPDEPLVYEVESHIYLSIASRNSEFLPLAERAVKRHFDLSPTNFVALNDMGTLAMFKEDWTNAETYLTEALAKNTNAPEARLNRAIAYLRAGQLGQALDDYRLLEEKAPKNYRVQFGLGEIAEKQNRAADALKHFETYLSQAPRGTPEYSNVLDRVSKLRGR